MKRGIIAFIFALALDANSASSIGYKSLESDCMLQSFSKTYLNFFGAESTPFFFVSLDKQTNCSEALHVDKLVQKINARFSNFEKKVPELFIVKEAANAFADNDLHVPFQMIGKNKAVIKFEDLSGIMVHEYGHLLFNWNIKKYLPELDALNETKSISLDSDREHSYLFVLKYLKAAEDIIKGQETFAESITADVEAYYSSLDMEDLQFQDANSIPFSEYFADVISVIYHKDPSIMKKEIERLSDEEISSIGRDFADASMSLQNIDQNAQSFSDHTLLAPSRYELYQLAFSNGDYSPRIAEKVLEAIQSTYRFIYSNKISVSNYENSKIINERFISDLRKAFSNY